jgi:predicted GTPase
MLKMRRIYSALVSRRVNRRGYSSDVGKHRHRIGLVAGPTAIGKSALCKQLAQKLNAEIVSLDSIKVR